MSYEFRRERAKLFTEEGQAIFVAVRDECRRLLEIAGAFQSMKPGRNVSYGESWLLLACLDLLVERGELRYVHGPADVHGQDWTFVAGPNWRSDR